MSHSQPIITTTQNLIPTSSFAECRAGGMLASLAAPAEMILPGQDAAATTVMRGSSIQEIGLQRPLDFELRNDPFMSESGVSIAPLLNGASMMLLTHRHRC